jgi:sulfotransferase
LVAGLPRSGSTLLCNLLAQNPEFHATATSGLPALVEAVQARWGAVEAFKAQGLENARPQVLAAVRGLVLGFHSAAYAEGAKVVFDKSRAWPQLIELMELAFGERLFVLYPVRDIREVVASFERKNTADPLLRRSSMATEVQRAEALLQPGGSVGAAVHAYRSAVRRGLPDRLVRVPFRQLTGNTLEVLEAIHTQLGFEPFPYDLQHVEQLTHENDEVYGIRGLHDVLPQVERRPVTWPGIYPQAWARSMEERYPEFTTAPDLAGSWQP